MARSSILRTERQQEGLFGIMLDAASLVSRQSRQMLHHASRIRVGYLNSH
ncbi:hypothetical protein LINPERHAP1_LOCUS8478 [Linum perenne]